VPGIDNRGIMYASVIGGWESKSGSRTKIGGKVNLAWGRWGYWAMMLLSGKGLVGIKAGIEFVAAEKRFWTR
jgi:hypothetical protein